MTAAFTSWQNGRKPGPPYNHASPNLVALAADLCHRYGLTNLGCYGVRPIRGIRGGTAWSSHAFGAAVDLGYTTGQRSVILETVIPELLAIAPGRGIQRVHDYSAKRYWEAGRGWIGRPPGIGGNWLHIEVTPERWADTPGTTTAPAGARYPGRPLRLGSTGANVKRVQTALGNLTVDGRFGPLTEKAVIAYQTAHHLEPDGIVGPITWAHLFG